MLHRVRLYYLTTRFLTLLVIALLLVILTGTVLAILRKGQALDEDDEKVASGVQHNLERPLYVLREGKAIYGELGQLRALSSDELPATIVLHPYLEYDADDIPLQEELVKKKDLIRQLFLNWFASHTWLSVETLGESAIKKELLLIINNELLLGRVSSIYFAEFKVVH